MDFLGIRLLGFNSENGRKLLFTFGLITLVIAVRSLITFAARYIFSGRQNENVRFWTYQTANLVSAALIILGVLSIWFDDPTRLTTAAGLITAGLAFALQKVVTSVAGYFVILRSRVFTVGDRILMAGVRGDVIRLGFVQTTVMEMGQPPGERPDDPKVWVKSRQFTGRIVTVTNDKIFDSPVFNYTNEFPYLWEELTIPVSYKDDRNKAEQIILNAAQRNAVSTDDMKEEEISRLQQHFFITRDSLRPHVYMRLTDNWIELSLRFLTKEHGSRDVKDTMSREILRDLEEAKIGIASATFEVIGMPSMHVKVDTVDRGKENISS
jgi:small-conductance mechanosensitive channel